MSRTHALFELTVKSTDASGCYNAAQTPFLFIYYHGYK